MASTREKNIVRELAGRVAELASSDEYEARRKRWRDVNALRRPDRAPVWCKPVGCRGDLIGADAMHCEDLTDKTDVLDAVDNLRIFVSSARTDLDRTVEACGDRHTIMWRQKACPTWLAVPRVLRGPTCWFAGR